MNDCGYYGGDVDADGVANGGGWRGVRKAIAED